MKLYMLSNLVEVTDKQELEWTSDVLVELKLKHST